MLETQQVPMRQITVRVAMLMMAMVVALTMSDGGRADGDEVVVIATVPGGGDPPTPKREWELRT